jgi:2',3'-cyclic-nucleotide 2'-phosphodiesterase/3'-nucleotidase
MPIKLKIEFMYLKKKWILTLLWSQTLVLACSQSLHILVTTDVHGHYFPYDYVNQRKGALSLSQVHYLVDSIRQKSNDQVLLLDNGDFMQGTPAAYFGSYIGGNGQLAIDLLEFVGYDAMTIGNHDIECGPIVYNRIQKTWQGTLLGANVIDTRTGNPYFKPYTILQKGPLKIAVLGLTTPGVPNWLPPSLWEHMEFADLVGSASYWSQIIREREQPDLLIGLIHSGLGSQDSSAWAPMAENAVFAIASTVPGFNILFTGHDHGSRLLKIQGIKGDSVLIVGGGSRCQEVSYVQIGYDDKIESSSSRVYISDASRISLSSMPESKIFNQKFKDTHDQIRSWSIEPICYLDTSFAFIDALKGPSVGMDFIHQVQLAFTDAEVSFAAPLSFNDTIVIGNLLNKDFFSLYSYENYLYTMELSGKEIRDYLEYSYNLWLQDMQTDPDNILSFKRDGEGRIRTDLPGSYRLKSPFFNLDAAAGMVYRVHIDSAYGQRIEIKSLMNGKPFKADQMYTVAVNSYRGSGGGGHLTKGAGISALELQTRIISRSDQEIRTLLRNFYAAQKLASISQVSQWEFTPEAKAKELLLKDIQLLLD